MDRFERAESFVFKDEVKLKMDTEHSYYFRVNDFEIRIDKRTGKASCVREYGKNKGTACEWSAIKATDCSHILSCRKWLKKNKILYTEDNIQPVGESRK
jgi:hypothetical protein